MTLTQIERRVLNLLARNSTDTLADSDALLDAVNDSLREAAERTRAMPVVYSTDTLTSGTPRYPLDGCDPPLAEVFWVGVGASSSDTPTRLTRMATDQAIPYEFPDTTQEAAGTPTHYAVSGNEVMLWPVPDTTVDGGLTFYGRSLPRLLVNGDDTCELANEAAEAATYLAAARLLEGYLSDEPNSLIKSQRLRARGEDLLVKAQEAALAKDGMPRTFTPGPEGHRWGEPLRLWQCHNGLYEDGS